MYVDRLLENTYLERTERFLYYYVILRNMVELISKVSKGSKMDQIYIPKIRTNFEVGSCVLIKPLDEIIEQKAKEKPYFYNIDKLEPVKLWVIDRIFDVLDKLIYKYDNIIITGSFLDEGFGFNDIDLIFITSEKIDLSHIESELEKNIGINFHIIVLDNNILIKGLNSDPLYQAMLSKCVTKKRFIYRIRQSINYKLLDLHLLKSKSFDENFDILTGDEKYGLVRNLIAIELFLHKKKVTKELVNKRINQILGKNTDKMIKKNILNKNEFLKKYKLIYNKTFKEIMNGIRHGSRQE